MIFPGCRTLGLAGLGLLGAWGCTAAGPVWRVVRSEGQGLELLRNGAFETVQEGRAAHWASAPQGCSLARGEGRSGSAALRCDSPGGKGWFGASQTLQLNRSNALPLVVRGWSKAAGVSGGTDSDYSLYADLIYTDGTPLWGQAAGFRAATHDWERREVVILPEKPVRSLTLHCLFRHRAGRAWFDDLQVTEMTASGQAVLFQGVPVQPATFQPTAPPGDFLVRDVAAGSDFFRVTDGKCPELGLTLQARRTQHGRQLAVQGRVADTTGRDRAVTVVFAVPLARTAGWRWGDDIRRSRPLEGQADYVNQVSVGCGATGTLSLYPLGAVWNETEGLALGLDMARPAQFRLGCHAGLRVLYLAMDFGLVKDTERFPSAADFSFVFFPFAPREGFRSAWQAYMEVFPAHFAARAREQGLWMPFTDVSTVQGWEDFGFRFHEGDNNVPWDDAHGVLSFRYTEPMTWWMPLKKEQPRTAAAALQVRDELLGSGKDSQRRMAEASRVAGMLDEAGQPRLQFHDTPWCNGAVWSLNPNPWLAGAPSAEASAAAPLNAATIYWSPAIREKLYGAKAKGSLDGEYLDSIEGYVTADLNFRREHFRSTTVPLTYSLELREPALYKGLAVAEFTRWLSEDVRGLGRLMFANGVPYRFSWLCPWLDVLGTETDWLRNGQYHPASLSQMDYWRTLSGAKPYLLLMNTDYDRFSPELVEKYFQRCLFYGMWPGFFSHNAADKPYWGNPTWYERDRPLFRKYVPVIRRVAEAGWQPVTHASCDNARVLIERYGAADPPGVFFTIFNDTPQPQKGLVNIQAAELGFGGQEWTLHELLSGETLTASPAGLPVRLDPQQARVIEVRRR